MNVISDYYNNKIVPFGIARRRWRKIKPLIENIEGKKILDIGCATGYIGATLRSKNNYVVGVDLSKKDIIKAKKVLNKAFVFDIENGDISKLGQKYDFIIMIEVMEHLFDPEATIRRFLPVLKKGGMILLSTPNFVHVYNRLKILFGIYEYKEETVINKSHIHFYTYPTFKKEMDLLGLRLYKENHVIMPVFLEGFLKFWPNLFIGQIVSVYEKT